MSWPGLLIRLLAVLLAFIVMNWNRTFLGMIGIEPTPIARIVWNIALVVPIFMLAFPNAKRVDSKVSEKWKV